MAMMNDTFFTNNEFMNLANLQMGGLTNLVNIPSINGINLSMIMQQHHFGQRLPSYVCPPEAIKLSAQESALHHLAPKKPERTSETKLFRRAAFHVAIAYHIHLKKVWR